MANGWPKRSVVSATLASVPSLPQASIMGHVMPAFPHTLIGLGPFADLGCKIVFIKSSVTVFHPDGHPLLSGWRDETGPRLWHFPLTPEAAQMALANASPQPHIPPTAEAAHVVVDTASHPPQLPIPPHLRALRQQTSCFCFSEETETCFRFHECTEPYFRFHECTETGFRFHECTETGFRFHECTEMCFRFHERTETVKSGRWQATPTCIPAPAGHIYSSAPSRRQAHRQVRWQRCVEDDDFLDGNEDDNQQEIRRRRVDGILLPPAMLLGAQENRWRTVANGYQQWRWCGIGR